MRNTNSNILIMIMACALTTVFSGCDLINPPKKVVKKEEKPPAPAEPAAPVEAAAPADLPKDVVARVGSWTLTEAQFEERLKLLKEGLPNFDASKAGSKEALLNELIRQQLLVKDAEDSGLAQQGDITEAVDDFRRTLLVQKLANQLTKDIVANEKEAQAYYDKNKEVFVEPLQYSVREIVTDDEATAKAVLVQILQGADFAETAKTQSKGKTAAEGGVLPAFTTERNPTGEAGKGMMSGPPFAAMMGAIANVDVGGISAVFKGPEGFYIVKVDAKKGGVAQPFAEVKQDLISGLTLRKQQEAILEHINQLADKTKVEVNKELLGPSK